MASLSTDTQNSKCSSEDKLWRSLSHLHYTSMQKFQKFTLYTSDAQETTDPKEVCEATMKIYAKGRKSENELLALEGLTNLYGDSLPIASLIALYTLHESQYIFVNHLEKSLAQEIDFRAHAGRYWSEDELWQHLWSISRAIYYLHALGFVHRNITPHSLFLKKGKLYLFHFEHCKKLNMGETTNVATIRGTESFLSPQAVLARNRGAGIKYTHEISRKDDVWGLGRTILDMATLTINSTLENHYNLPQTEFSQLICNLIGTRYSSPLKDVITGLLTIEDRDRSSFEDFYEELGRIYYVGKCIKCEQKISTLWKCRHIQCENCLERDLLRLVTSKSSQICLCTCQINVPLPFFERYPRAKRLAELILVPEQKCDNGHSYSVLNANNEPYFITCTCGLKFCSFCKNPKGHSILGVRRRCPDFARLTSI